MAEEVVGHGTQAMRKSVSRYAISSRFKVITGMCRGNELNVDEEYDNDGTLDMYESRASKGDREQQVKREKARQVSDYRRAPAPSTLWSHCTCLKQDRHLLASQISAGAQNFINQLFPQHRQTILAACLYRPLQRVFLSEVQRSRQLHHVTFQMLTMQFCRRASNALEACAWCLSSNRRPKHLTVSIGQTAYLMLPPRSGPCPYKCQDSVAGGCCNFCDALQPAECRNVCRRDTPGKVRCRPP